MKRTTMLPAMAALLALTPAAISPVYAQNQSAAATSAAPNEVAPGTRFLIGCRVFSDQGFQKRRSVHRADTGAANSALTERLSRQEPEVRGHVDKVESAGKTGRARMWLASTTSRPPTGGCR